MRPWPAPRMIGIGTTLNWSACVASCYWQRMVVTEQAEGAYRRAIQIAQKQQAKIFELRATTSLAQFWLMQGKSAEARRVLAQVVGWFSEGLDMSDLQNAQVVLDTSLSEASP